MNEATLPPSPNWYLSNILACSKRGTVAWGAKNNIVIAKHKEDDRALEFSIIKCAQKDRVTCLAFCPKSEPDDPELIISCGDDDSVNIWNLDTLQMTMKFSFNDNKPIVGVDWSVKDHKLACAVNSDGILLSCNTQYEFCKKIPLPKLAAVCLACCPHDASLVAIGSKNGLIYIVDLDKNGLILYRLRGHNEQIVSLSWCPSDINVLCEDAKRDLLLASGAKDRSVFIWRAGGDGRYEIVLTIPKLPIESQSHKSKLNAVVGNWIVVHWVEPKLLLTSSAWGELLSWDLSNKKKPICQLLHTYHNRGLFCIATVPKCDAISDNWRADSGLTIWTSAQDRWLICCCKQKSDPVELKRKISTQGGYVYCIAACSIDTTCIAFGAGDAMLRLLKLSESHVTTFDVTMFWQKIKGKLRAIAWYPECERSIAFGTSEGRVGIFDVIKNDAILFRQYHRNVVYKLEWGPVPENDILSLYSCSEGELVAYDIKNPDKKPKSIIKEGCTEFSWKPDKLMLTIALENGSIMFYDKKLKKCGNAIFILKKIVNCLVWHPESTAADTWNSPMKDYLAVAFDSPSIIILDVSDLRKKLETQEEIADPVEDRDSNQQRSAHKIVAKLNGHFDKVVCLAWSPHFSGHLVSGSYDNTAQVWNVETKELMGTYSGHSGPVLSCMWSPFKPQFIMTGSSDFMLCIWDYTSSKQSPKQVCEGNSSKYDKTQKCKSRKNKRTNESVALDNSNANDSMVPVKQSATSTTEACKTESKPAVQHAGITGTLAKDASKKKEKKSYFPIYTKMINEMPYIIDCIKSDIRSQKQSSELQNGEKEQNKEQNSLEKEEKNDDVPKLSLFSEQDLSKILANERIAHAAKNKHSIVTEMDLWHDNLKQNLECAVKEKRLTDFLVSLSTSLSMKTWREMCEAYAHQLMEDNVEKAVSYLLCINKIYEAIKAFLDAKMYKEAYALAKLRLDADDPVLAIVLQSWALHASNSGQLEQAAHCYIKLGEFTKAARTLSRRKDLRSLELASELAFMNGDEEFGLSLIKEAVARALTKFEYSKAHSIIANIRQSQYLKVHIDAHEAIMTIYKKETRCNLMRTWLEGESDCDVLQILKEKYGTSYYDAFCDFTPNITMENQATMQLNASYLIAMAATCNARETQLKHIVTALNNIFEYETRDEKCAEMKFFIYILAMLDAKKPTDESSIYAKSDYSVSTSIRAYLCSGLLNWLIIDLQELSLEEEVRFTELIETLLDDVFQQTVKDDTHRTDKIKELEFQLTTLMVDRDENGKDEWTSLMEKLNNLKLDRRNFIEERVCALDPDFIYNQAQELSKIMRDETEQSRFLEILNHKYQQLR